MLILVLYFLCTTMGGDLLAQTPQESFDPMDKKSDEYKQLLADFGQNKQLPAGYETQALLALSFYPELSQTPIRFVFKERRTPFSCRPTFFSLFLRPEKRRYRITVSTQTVGLMNKILLNKLPFNAQIGVLGHEFGHAAYFQRLRFGGLIRSAFGQLSRKYVDRFEYANDQLVLDHGLGYQLLAWSIFVREALQIVSWPGADRFGKPSGENAPERYMNPNTIREIMAKHPRYNGL